MKYGSVNGRGIRLIKSRNCSYTPEPISLGLRIKESVELGVHVKLRVGDEDAIVGRVIWSKDGCSGLKFE